LIASLGVLSLACGEETWKATGVVEQLLIPDQQVVIAHQDIPDLMPAMTMNFYADPGLLARLEVGQEIAFTLAKRGNAFTLTEFRVVAEGAGRSGVSDPLAETADPAAPFTFTDQSGATLSLSDLRGKAVLLDFIFTHCPGPCPILTGVKAEVQRELSPETLARVHFVSITLDPARDTQEGRRASSTSRTGPSSRAPPRASMPPCARTGWGGCRSRAARSSTRWRPS
jgi:protein SCO1/2